jgi:mRNA interferase YafQ
MYSIEYSGQFKKALKRCAKRGYPLDLLSRTIAILSEKGELPAEYKPHILSGKYAGIWECHIKPDWLLLWRQDNDKLVLLLLTTGTHSDIF